MNKENSNSICLNNNKFNINLLETVDHNELFSNLNTNSYINNSKSKKNQKKINLKKEKKQKYFRLINSKSNKDILKNKFRDNPSDKISPGKNKRCETQENNNTKEGCLRNFEFKRNNNKENMNINMNIDDYFSKNNTRKTLYINNENKKEESNISKNSFNSYGFINNKNLNMNNNLDVYNRLYNQSYLNKTKNTKNISNNNDEKNCTFNPKINPEVKLKNSNENYIDDFIKRQEKYNRYIRNKKIEIKNDINKSESKKFTFNPNVSYTSGSKYAIKLDAQRQEETRVDKANRMIYDYIKKKEEKKNKLFLIYNKQYSFIPSINKNNLYKKNGKKECKYFKKPLKMKKENKSTEEITAKPKYLNHQYDDIKSNYKNDKELMKRIIEERRKRTKMINKMRKEKESEDYESCTFKPDISGNKNFSYFRNCTNNIEAYNYYNSNKEMSYVNNYNKKKEYNKKNHSQVYRNRNTYFLNSNTNYNCNCCSNFNTESNNNCNLHKSFDEHNNYICNYNYNYNCNFDYNKEERKSFNNLNNNEMKFFEKYCIDKDKFL